MNTLPTVKLDDMVVGINPDFKPGTDDEYYLFGSVVVDVLTIHIQKNNMRVRYVDNDGKKRTIDVSATPFFEAYEIKGKKNG